MGKIHENWGFIPKGYNVYGYKLYFKTDTQCVKLLGKQNMWLLIRYIELYGIDY